MKETPLVQLLNLSESEDGMEWNPCKLMLVEQQENYQIEIYCPPKVSVCVYLHVYSRLISYSGQHKPLK